jgi:epoxyqueuosine reductase
LKETGMDQHTLTRRIKGKARQLGFSLAGVTTPDPPPHLDFYREWLEAGYHGAMGWMASQRNRERRADPRRILPGCQSILCLAHPYPYPEQLEGRGNISSYAWNQDYHDVLGAKLTEIAAYVQDLVGHEISHRWYTDTGPILERDLASRAGLGWIGKNTTLIHPDQGSFFFLAEILFDLALEIDPPFDDELCGSCTRCLEACPTGCLTAPYTLDSNRCISYLTIEYRESLPEELRPILGEWIFGCDICQQVCPWNKRFGQHDRLDEDLLPREQIQHPELAQELGLSQEEFSRKFKGSPLKRTKRRGYLRNIAVALGNQARKEAVPPLHRALGDPEPLVREHAAWALGEIGGKSAREALREVIESEDHQKVIAAAVRALKKA